MGHLHVVCITLYMYNKYNCMYVYVYICICSCIIYIRNSLPHCWSIRIWLIHYGVCFQFMTDMFLIMYHPCIKLNASFSTY